MPTVSVSKSLTGSGRLLRMPKLKDFEFEQIRKNVQTIVRAICEHV